MLKIIYQPKGRAAEYCSWAANLYRGCGHRCIFCYAPSALQMPVTEYQKPIPRAGIIEKLTKDGAELKSRGEHHKILLCFSCDPFQPINEQFHLAEQAIEVLHFYGQSVAILTKGGHRADHGIALLKAGDEFAVTLTCDNATQSLKWEPNAASPAERVDSLLEAHTRGIFTWVSLEPVLYPEQSLAIIRRTRDFVDKYKLGTLNYDGKLPLTFRQEVHGIDWADYGSRAIALLQKYGKDYYVKNDLKKYLTVPI